MAKTETKVPTTDKEGRWQVVDEKNVVVASGIVWAGPKDFLHVAINVGIGAADVMGLGHDSVTAFAPKGKKNFIAQLRKRPKDGQLPWKAVDSGEAAE